MPFLNHSSGLYQYWAPQTPIPALSKVRFFYSTAAAGNMSVKRELLNPVQTAVKLTQELHSLNSQPKPNASREELCYQAVAARMRRLRTSLRLGTGAFALASCIDTSTFTNPNLSLQTLPEATRVLFQTWKAVAAQCHQSRPFDCQSWPTGEAQITRESNIALSYPLNGCAPVALVSLEVPAVALIHASRRNCTETSLFKAAVGNFTVHPKMYGRRARRLRLSHILAIIGPHQRNCCYHLRTLHKPLEDYCRKHDANFQRLKTVGKSDFLTRNSDSSLAISLENIIIERLLRAGIPSENIVTGAPCTHCANDEMGKRIFHPAPVRTDFNSPQLPSARHLGGIFIQKPAKSLPGLESL